MTSNRYKKAEDIAYYTMWVLFFVLAILFINMICCCNAPKKTQAQKDFEFRQERIKQLEDLRKEFPCDTLTKTVTQSDTVFQYMRKDSVVYLSPDDSIVYINRYHTVEKTITQTVTLVDRAEIQAARDSIDNVSFLFDAAVKSSQECTAINDQLQHKISSLNIYKGLTWGFVATCIVLGIIGIVKRKIKV